MTREAQWLHERVERATVENRCSAAVHPPCGPVQEESQVMTIGIGVGLAEFPFSSASAFWRWIALCEAGGVDSFWQTDRLVSTIAFLETMSAMAAVAGATERMKFGMNVASVGLRDPLLLAKQCATVDFLSQGRLLPAFGVGSALAPDWAATGRTFKGSGKLADEALTLIARLWTEEKGHCSKATGFIQPVHDEVMPGFADGLRRGLHATYPAQGACGSARASAPGRHSFASCDSAGCSAPPHSRWRAAACHRETSRPFPTWGQRVSSVSPPLGGTVGADVAGWPTWPERSESDSVDRITHIPGP